VFELAVRTLAEGNALRAWVTHVTDDYIPFFTSGQLPAYQQALLTTYG